MDRLRRSPMTRVRSASDGVALQAVLVGYSVVPRWPFWQGLGRLSLAAVGRFLVGMASDRSIVLPVAPAESRSWRSLLVISSRARAWSSTSGGPMRAGPVARSSHFVLITCFHVSSTRVQLRAAAARPRPLTRWVSSCKPSTSCSANDHEKPRRGPALKASGSP